MATPRLICTVYSNYVKCGLLEVILLLFFVSIIILQVASLKFDRYYLNDEQSSVHHAFNSGIHTIRTRSDIYAKPIEVSQQVHLYIHHSMTDVRTMYVALIYNVRFGGTGEKFLA